MEASAGEEDSFLRENNVDLNDNAAGSSSIALDVSSLEVESGDLIPGERVQFEFPDVAEPALGMEFDTDEAAKEFYVAYASRVGFGVRMNKSRRSRRDDTVIMRRFVCTREGFHSKRVIYDDGKKKRKRGTTREGCMAMIEVIKKEHGKWAVSKLVTEHTHLVLFPSKIRPRPEKLSVQSSAMALQQGDAGAAFNNLKYFNRGMRVNPFGEGGEAQSILEHLKRRQAENPAFFYAIQVDNNNCMTNVFWADAKARLAYRHFGDCVVFDTTYKKTRYMMPFASFRGVNHHLQSVNFGCALLMDETKGSYIWLFETWLAAMGGRRPISLVTDRDKAMEGAIGRVFPDVCHYLCKWHILSRCKQKLSDVYSKHASLNWELKHCVNETDTVDEFEACWEAILSKYNLWENAWLQSLHEIRDRWVPVFLKTAFFPELCGGRRLESLNKFFKCNFNTKTSLLAFVTRFEQSTASQYENEVRADFSAAYAKPVLKTPSGMEKQAAELYTGAVFEKFQEEFVQSLGYIVERVEQDGPLSKFSVTREEGTTKAYFVSLHEPENQVGCSCCKFESCGILCRHILRVFFIVGIRNLPDKYILRRWTRSVGTDNGDMVEEVAASGLSFQEHLVAWYNDLCRDAVRYGMEGAVSGEMYRVAKASLQKAFADLILSKSLPKKAQQHSMQRIRVQKMQYKMPLPKLPMGSPHGREDTTARRKRNTPDDSV